MPCHLIAVADGEKRTTKEIAPSSEFGKPKRRPPNYLLLLRKLGSFEESVDWKNNSISMRI